MKYIIIVFLITFSALYADILAGYYAGTEGLTGEELNSALHDINDNK